MLINRYERTDLCLSEEDNRIIHEKKALVVGCGGLGEFIIDGLLRLGIKQITIVDGDRFEASNLNRQIYSLETNLGKQKVSVIKERARHINSSVKVIPLSAYFTRKNSLDLAMGHDLIFDALDSVKDRFLLQSTAKKIGTPLIHGAIEGDRGQVALIEPGDDLLNKIYPGPIHINLHSKKIGSLPFSPGIIGGMQLSMGLQVFLKQTQKIKGKVFYYDFKTFQMEKITLLDNKK